MRNNVFFKEAQFVPLVIILESSCNIMTMYKRYRKASGFCCTYGLASWWLLFLLNSAYKSRCVNGKIWNSEIHHLLFDRLRIQTAYQFLLHPKLMNEKQTMKTVRNKKSSISHDPDFEGMINHHGWSDSWSWVVTREGYNIEIFCWKKRCQSFRPQKKKSNEICFHLRKEK